jgi:hypothetical protein
MPLAQVTHPAQKKVLFIALLVNVVGLLWVN